MSPTLFCVALTILKTVRLPDMNNGDNPNWSHKVCYMDDIKIFESTISALDNKVTAIRKLGSLIGLEINESKSGLVTGAKRERIALTNSLRTFPLIKEDCGNAYKYLGFKQVWINGNTTKDDITKEAVRRLRKIIGSHLTLVNIGKQISISVVPLIRYVSQAIDWKLSELNNLNRLTRCLMKRKGLIPYRICNARLYVAHSKGGIGLPNFIEEDYLAICSTLRYMADQGVEELNLIRSERTPSTVIMHEQYEIQNALDVGADPYSVIITKLEKRKAKIDFGGKQDWSSKTGAEERKLIRSTFQSNYWAKWNDAKLRSPFNTVRKDPETCISKNHLWLRRPGLSRRDVKQALLLQDGIGSHRSWQKVVNPDTNVTCRRCNKKSETVGHVLGACPAIPFSLLKARHDAVVLMIANEIIAYHDLGKKLSLQDTGGRVARNSHKFKLILDQRITVGDGPNKTVQLPDIVCIDKVKKRITIAEIGVSVEDLTSCKEEEKIKKYRKSAAMLTRRYRGYTVDCRAFVIGQLGAVSSVTHRNLYQLRKSVLTKKDHRLPKRPIEELYGKLLNVTIKGSLQIYRWFISDAVTPKWEARDRAPAVYTDCLKKLVDKRKSERRARSPKSAKHRVRERGGNCQFLDKASRNVNDLNVQKFRHRSGRNQV